MAKPSTHVIHDPRFLRLLIDLQRGEGVAPDGLHIPSMRELFFRVAESLLDDAQASKYQTLKFLSDLFTDRAMRQRIRDFEALGLITVQANSNDTRTKQLVPTHAFFSYFNRYVALQRQVCERHMHLIDKT